MINVIKRNGEIVRFDKSKIEIAILKAMKYGTGYIEEEVAKNIASIIENHFKYVELDNTPTIHQIEKMVFELLARRGCLDVAQAYEGYRAIQQFKRETNTTDESILGLLNATNEELLKENSNKDSRTASTQRDLIAGEISKDIAHRRLLPTRIVQAHNDGILHYHDADYAIQPIFNCCLINLEDMLNNGTVINEKLVETPKSFETACTVTTQIIAQVASGQYGGNSITSKHLAPFLKKTYDKEYEYHLKRFNDETIARDEALYRMKKALKDGVQTIRYQLSTLQTSNGQSPFTTIYLEIDKDYGYEYEQSIIIEEMLKQRIEGMKNYKGQNIAETFPKLIYLLDEHNCLDGGKYDNITKLACESSAKRMAPDYQSAKIMRNNYEGQTFPPMGQF